MKTLRIIRYADRMEFQPGEPAGESLDEYVFVAGPTIQTIYAFAKGDRAAMQRWADEAGVRRVFDLEPAEIPLDPEGQPTYDVDRVELVMREVDALAESTGVPRSSPMLFRFAHDVGIVGSAKFYADAHYGTSDPAVPPAILDVDCADLTTRLPLGARSVQTKDTRKVLLYTETRYRPNRDEPYLTLVSCQHAEDTLKPIKSVRFATS